MTDAPERPELDYQPADDFRRESNAALKAQIAHRTKQIWRGPAGDLLKDTGVRALFYGGIVLVGLLAWLCVLALGLITG